jgi:hemolysin activation/secretion protein
VSWTGERSETDLSATVTFHARGAGSSSESFNNNRRDADASFVHLRGDLSRSQDVFGGVQLFGKVQGQVSDQPLVPNEQFAIGGLGTVRGYVEGEQVGDSGVAGTVEIRSPSLSWVLPKVVDEWRVYAFTDAGQAYVIKALPEQEDRFTLASFGIGTRVKVKDSFDGSLDVGYPLVGQPNTSRHVLRLTFTVGASF